MIETQQAVRAAYQSSDQLPSWLNVVLPPAILITFVILSWQSITVASGISSFILPTPVDVINAGWETRRLLGPAIATTLLETAIGLSIALILGVLLAAAMDFSRFLRRALYPLLVASQTVQILAIAPLLIIWFGFGLLPKVLVVILICFFPLTVSITDGLSAARAEHLDLMRVLGATPAQTWRIVRLPSALPAFFSGLRIAVTYSVVGATIGEWVGGSQGLGLYLLRSKNALATDQVFVAMLITSLLSIGLFVLVTLIERISLRWYFRSGQRDKWR